MAKLVVVQGDSVTGTDKHNVKGDAANPAAPPPTVPYAGVGDYTYRGKVTVSLTDFVKIGGKSVALVASKTSLDPGEIDPGGKHHGASGSSFDPPQPSAIPQTLRIVDAIGTGAPNAAAGSSLLTIGGTKALLDHDKIDTCDGTGREANSTVTVSGQDFVRCSE